MIAELRIKTLIENLSEKEIQFLDNFINSKTNYGQLYHKLRNKKSLADNKPKINKSTTDTIYHLEEKILEGLMICSEDEWVQELVELAKIRILLNQDNRDVGLNRLSKLYNKKNPKEELLRGILLNWSFQSVESKDKDNLDKVLNVLKQINGFWNKENLIKSNIDLINFIESYKGYQTDIKDKYTEIWNEYRFHSSINLLDAKVVLQFKTLLDLLNFSNKFKNEIFYDIEDYKKSLNEIELQLKIIDLPKSLSGTLTFYMLRDYLEFENEFNFKPKSIDFSNVELISDSIIDDVVLRIELNSFIFKVMEYDWMLDRTSEKAIKYYKTIQGLIKKTQEYSEITLLLKYLECLIYNKIDDVSRVTSTYYAYRNELIDSGHFYVQKKALLPNKDFLYFTICMRAFERFSR